MRLLPWFVLVTAVPVLAGCGSNPTRNGTAATQPSPRPAVSHRGSAFDGESALRHAGAGRYGPETGVTRGHYAGRADVERFIDRMTGKGYSRAELVSIFSRVEPDPWIIEYMNRQWRPASGPTGAWTRYRNRHITADQLARGDAFWRAHEQALARASAKYGVPPEYVVAIIGIETKWGGYMGKHRIVDALATLAFDYPRRADYFSDELEQFLLMAKDQRLDPFQPVGSFAGAMGLGQFMPSSWHDYAVDFDGDGHRNLWDPDDAIGSVANYFHKHGWRTGQPVTARAAGGDGLPWAMDTGFKTEYSVSSLKAQGLQPAAALSDDQRVSLLRLDAAGGLEYWLGFDNFYVITRYNNSTYYAMTVHQMAQALRARHGGGPTLRMTRQPVTERGALVADAR